jgi:hypothetical protein
MFNSVEAVDGVNYAISQLPEYIGQVKNAVNELSASFNDRHVFRFIEIPNTNVIVQTSKIIYIAIDEMEETLTIHLPESQKITIPSSDYEPLMHALLGTPDE